MVWDQLPRGAPDARAAGGAGPEWLGHEVHVNAGKYQRSPTARRDRVARGRPWRGSLRTDPWMSLAITFIILFPKLRALRPFGRGGFPSKHARVYARGFVVDGKKNKNRKTSPKLRIRIVSQRCLFLSRSTDHDGSIGTKNVVGRRDLGAPPFAAAEARAGPPHRVCVEMEKTRAHISGFAGF